LNDTVKHLDNIPTCFCTMAIENIIEKTLDLLNGILRMKKAGDQIKKVVGIYDNMNSVVQKSPVESFIVHKAENGGGLIKPGSHLYSSMIYESFRAPAQSVKEKYQRVELDGEYIQMLARLYAQGSVRVLSATMPDGIMKTAFRAEETMYSEFYYLHHDRKAFYYCSLSTKIPNESFADFRVRNDISIAINNIRNLLK
jgi:hypothetical protein